jgi:uncharacterized membrane protein
MYHIKLRSLLFSAVGALALFDSGLLLVAHSFWWLQLAVSLPIILLLSGVLFLMLLGARHFDIKNLLLATGMSLLSLLVIGLVANYLPEAFGDPHPLHSATTIPLLYNIFVGIEILSVFLLRKRIAEVTLPVPRLGLHDFIGIVFSFIVLLLSVFGAFRLNNGASNIVSMTALCVGFCLMVGTIVWNRRLSTFTIVVVIFSIALSTLLLTSLRSWGITGHDIKVEYMVYSLTAQVGKWDIGNYRNAYNACMSITILPVVFTKLLHVDGLVVFKFIDQVLFALCPIGIFILSRRYVTRTLSFLGAMLFVGFPTFAIDSPMLTRQEIAFVFFVFVLIAWFAHEGEWLKKRWREVFLLMSIGIILSHYSTTYMYVALLVLTYLSTYIYGWWDKKARHENDRLSLIMIIAVMLMAFLWYSQTSQVSKGLTNALGNSFANLTDLFNEDNRGNQVNYALFGFGSSKNQQLNEYINDTKGNHAIDSQQALNSIGFTDSNLLTTGVMKSVSQFIHIDLGHVANLLYYAVAPKLYQLIVGGGIVLLLVSRKTRERFKNIPIQYMCVCIAGVIILGLQIVLPNISLSYGLMRAFQQCLIFFTLPMLLALYMLVSKVRPSLAIVGVTIYTLFNMLLFSNFLPQLAGGVPAALSLNNSGPYYGAYYAFKSDSTAAEWLKASVPSTADARATCFSSAKTSDPSYPFSKKDILPFQTTSTTYILLCHSQTVDDTLYISVAHNLLPVSLTPASYQDRNLIYSNTNSTIFK